MAVEKYKTWVDNEVLTAADLNASFDQVFDNQASFGYPREASADFNGNELILDADADTSITADTDDLIDFKIQGQDLVKFDGTTATSVNGFTLLASATGSAPQLKAHGSDTNIGITLTPKGSGVVTMGSALDMNGNAITLDADADSTLRETADDVVALRLQGVDAFIFDGDVASAANGLTFAAAADGSDVTITAQGSSTNVNVALVAKGSGVVKLGSATVTATPTASAVPIANGSGDLADGWISESSVTQHADAVNDLVLLESYTPSGASSVDIDSTVVDGTTYYQLMIAFKLRVGTDSVELQLRTSTDNGSSVDSGASDYAFALEGNTTGGSVEALDDTRDHIQLCDGTSDIGSASGESISGSIWLTHFGDGTDLPSFTFSTKWRTPAGVMAYCTGAGHRGSATAINFIRLLASSGTLSGSVRVYGLKAS